MTKIVALGVQPANRPTTARPAAPVALAATPQVEAAKPAATPLAPQLQAFADIRAVIQLQAAAHADPQPTHGNDDQHGHKPADPPPVVQPPVVQPPVTQPPVIDPPPMAVPPPVVQPPAPRPVVDGTAAAGRSLAVFAQEMTERAAIRAEGEAFTAYAAERAAFAAVNRDTVATSLLQAFRVYA